MSGSMVNEAELVEYVNGLACSVGNVLAAKYVIPDHVDIGKGSVHGVPVGLSEAVGYVLTNCDLRVEADDNDLEWLAGRVSSWYESISLGCARSPQHLNLFVGGRGNGAVHPDAYVACARRFTDLLILAREEWLRGRQSGPFGEDVAVQLGSYLSGGGSLLWQAVVQELVEGGVIESSSGSADVAMNRCLRVGGDDDHDIDDAVFGPNESLVVVLRASGAPGWLIERAERDR